MEYFNLLDNNKIPTAQTKLRSEVHRDGDWHRAVDIWIINSKKELLIQKRAEDKDSYPGKWEISCSGHISAGGQSLLSAVREVKEELGIDIKKEDLKYLFTVEEEHITNNGTFINKEIKKVYLLEKDIRMDEFKLQKDEVSQVKFMPFLKLEEDIKNTPDKFVPHKQGYKKIFQYLKEKFSK